ncbi:MAG: GSCFA domain-containing protein [Saprospiraceae bacterium]|nr:GSCFA domain-containing protein [Saprospiraceae bacterium]
MQTFRTELKPRSAPFSIDYQCFMLGIGSCFIENMGSMLSARQLPFLQNPFGIVYNPLSMAQQLATIFSSETPVFFTEKDLVQQNGLWHSLQHHGHFSGENQTLVLHNINENIEKARVFAQKTNRLFLTLGTANTFVWKETDAVVANCHKIPPQYFTPKRLSVAEIVEAFTPVFEKIFLQNPDCRIILTVSPIRHTRDGLVENNRSKAVLLLACEALCQRFSPIYYFPAYELVMDDLRDYRFYERDMIHPNAVAIDYIWQQFSDTFFDKKTKSIIEEVEKINQMRAHRPLHGVDTEGYQKFKKQLDEKVKNALEKYPFLSYELIDFTNL